MDEKRQERAVGFVVTAGLMLLVLGIVWGKKTDVFSRRTRLTAHFDNVRGLEKGDPVMLRGISQGEVEGIGLGHGFVEVRLALDGGIPLFADTRVFVEDADLMGGKQVSIDPGTGPAPLPPDTVITGLARLDMLGTLASGGRVIARLDSLLVRLKSVTDPQRLDAVFRNIEGTSALSRGILEENRSAIRSTLAQLEEVTRTFREDSTASRLGKTVSRFDSALAGVRRLVQEAEREDGTVGKLVRDRTLYDKLIQASTNLDSLIADVKKNPQKYIRVTVF